jgi:hypothetical protein
MSRVSRGFHRLGLFLAVTIVLVGGCYWLWSGLESAGWYLRHHRALMCARDFLQRDEKRFWELSLFREKPYDIDTALIDLRALECSQPANDPMEIVKFREVRDAPSSFSRISTLGSQLLIFPILFIAISTIILALATYGVVRVIGWVVGGFSRDE